MMRKIKILVSVYMVIFLLISVNQSDAQSPTDKTIIVILDTSDRITNDGQVEKDKKIVHSIVDLFETLVSDHIATIQFPNPVEYPHRLFVVVPEQPGGMQIPSCILSKLSIEDNQRLKRRDAFNKQIQTLRSGVDELYAFVSQDNTFPGSDIWTWFKEEADGYFSQNHQNLIICLSDGYLNFDRPIEVERPQGSYMKVSSLRLDPDNALSRIQNGEGLKVVVNFSDHHLKCLMLEIAIRGKLNQGRLIPYQDDFDIIKAYWQTWLKEMGIQAVDFIKSGRPVDRTLRSFIFR